MRILFANKFYYPRGGDCVYTIGLEKNLRKAGHEVAIFAMDYLLNADSPWKKYWPREVSFTLQKPFGFIRAFKRPFGDKETGLKFNALLDDFKPDVLHLNNIHTQLSPIIAEIAHKRGVRVVWTLHDYKLICPSYLCLCKGSICEKCFAGDKSFCLANRCVKNSWIASWIAKREAETWNVARLEKCVDIFISPSEFLKCQMIKGGFDVRKITVLPNFMDLERLKGPPPQKGENYCYVGRLSEEKGIRTLLNVAKMLPYRLTIVGGGPLEAELREFYAADESIEFLGHQGWEKCKEVIASARFSVMPSEWYENNPFSVIESLCLGTPVLGANIGGIPELVVPGETGELFQSGDTQELKKKIDEMYTKEYGLKVEKISARFGWDVYKKVLMHIYMR